MNREMRQLNSFKLSNYKVITRMLEQTMEEKREKRKTEVADIYLVDLIKSEITKALGFILIPH